MTVHENFSRGHFKEHLSDIIIKPAPGEIIEKLNGLSIWNLSSGFILWIQDSSCDSFHQENTSTELLNYLSHLNIDNNVIMNHMIVWNYR